MKTKATRSACPPPRGDWKLLPFDVVQLKNRGFYARADGLENLFPKEPFREFRGKGTFFAPNGFGWYMGATTETVAALQFAGLFKRQPKWTAQLQKVGPGAWVVQVALRRTLILP